ncbi:MAG: hypothetical protein WCD11_15270, partial [Solirubrobacteraceae bacterium]
RKRRATIASDGRAPLQFLQRGSQRLLLDRIRECDGRVVGTAEIAPKRSGPPPLAGELERVRLR